MPTLRCPWSDVVIDTEQTKITFPIKPRAMLPHSAVVDGFGRAIPDPNVKHVPAGDTPTTDPGRDAVIADLRARLQALEQKDKPSDKPPVVSATPTATAAPGPVPVE